MTNWLVFTVSIKPFASKLYGKNRRLDYKSVMSHKQISIKELCQQQKYKTKGSLIIHKEFQVGLKKFYILKIQGLANVLAAI
jgi:hypothetical protein